MSTNNKGNMENSNLKKITEFALLVMPLLTLVAAVSSCGGGGGGTMAPPPNALPSPTLSPGFSGVAQVATGGSYPGPFSYAPAAGANVVFSCGCSKQAGTATTSNSATFTVVPNSTPTPSLPDPTYTTVPGREYVAVISSGAQGAPPEAWDIQFVGRNPSRNHYLNGSNTTNVYTAAVALYVFYESGSSSTAFDDWNFNSLAAWYSKLAGVSPSPTPNPQEQKLLDDIASQSAASQTLYPSEPSWDGSHATNPIIQDDLKVVATSGDKTLPTPCPGNNCTGTPTP
jgi:hypothetical protein